MPSPVSQRQQQQREDLYLLMLREDHPNAASLSLAEILAYIAENNLSPSQTTAGDSTPDESPKQEQHSSADCAESVSSSSSSSSRGVCITQPPSSSRLFLGASVGHVYLWASGSELKWVARRDGYSSREEALYAAAVTYLACEEWNVVMEGRVKFSYVSIFDDACFQLCRAKPNSTREGVVARAFFPKDAHRELSALRICDTFFDNTKHVDKRGAMLHELGHILGMRHEHAHGDAAMGWRPEDRRSGAQSVLWGSRNPKSVMAYYNAQRIQESDAKALRDAYDQLQDGMVFEVKGAYAMVKKVVRRVHPKN